MSSLNKNKVVANTWHNYMMQPGDATLYRFGFCEYPTDPDEAYVLDSGVGKNPRTEYIKFYINMQSGVGMGTLLLGQLDIFPEHTFMIGYLKGHGFGHIHTYTLVAVLLALKVLINHPQALDEAAKNMLDAERVIREIE